MRTHIWGHLKPLLVQQLWQRHPVRCDDDRACLRDVTRRLSRVLLRSRACTHLRGHGGQKGAVRRTQRAVSDHRYLCRTDVKSYYASIDHVILLDQLAPYVDDRNMMRTLVSYMRRTVEYGGTFRDITKGIPAGCTLSPLMGAFHLHDLDVAMTTRHSRCFYIRYMDDILILAPTRWQLHRAIATLRRHLAALGLSLHPDKTTIGPIARGFDFLGYQFDPDGGLALSKVTLKRHQEKLTRLYERYHRQMRANRAGWIGQSTIPCRHDPARAYLNQRPTIKTHEDITQLIEAYQRRFIAWAQGGLKECST